ncbi:hypothetical protein L902_03625 [Agrobacterium radiobacter DSM 30147]|nr:hypothetical protein L902_03625 [Agrobacterium radiobacter DSM 30147]
MHAVGFQRLLKPSGEAGKYAGDGQAKDKANQDTQVTVCIH